MNNLLLLALILVVIWLIFGMSNVTVVLAALALVWYLFTQSKNNSLSTL